MFFFLYLARKTRALAPRILGSFVLAFALVIPVRASDDLPVLDVLFYEDVLDSFISEEGKIEGLVVDKVRLFLDQTGIKYKFKLLPWARLYRDLMISDHALGANLLRSPEREDKFHWIYQLSYEEEFLIARNSPEMLNFDMKSLSSGDYIAICDHLSAQCELLEKLGFPDDNILRVYDLSVGKQARMVLRGRVDFMIDNLNDVLEELGFTHDQFVEVGKVHKTEVHLVAPKSIDPRLLKILTSAHRQ